MVDEGASSTVVRGEEAEAHSCGAFGGAFVAPAPAAEPKKRQRVRSSGGKHMARNLRKLAAFNGAHDTNAAAAEPTGDHTHGGT